MAALPASPFVPVEVYLRSSYPGGDREYLDGVIVERNLGTPSHSALQKILVVHLAALEKQFNISVRPECRTRIQDTRYRVPDVLVMAKPFRQTDRVILDPPLIVVEILSPDDRMRETIQRFRDYQDLGVQHIIQMDPEDRTTFAFQNGNLVRRDIEALDLPGRAPLPFNSRQLLAALDEA